ncbi:MAG: endolytic transglycosylase MltG [Patescibacteria group bacterium]
MPKIKVFLIFLVVFAIVFSVWFVNSLFLPASKESNLVYFQVKAGENTREIASNLKEQDLIKSGLVFRMYAKMKRMDSKIQAGEHKLSTDMDVREIIKELTSGKSVDNEKKITIIEGWRAGDIGKYLEEQRLIKKEEFLSAIKTSDWTQYDFLKNVEAETLEGFLFPDTYRVFSDASAKDIVKKMLDNFDSKLTQEMRTDIVSQKKNVLEIVTMASIVEKEALSDEDKKMVADVFWKRIDLNMGLQSDATVNYITGKKDTRPLAVDLEVDSPYNTYKYKGLPPGPICNPGLAALNAAIYPKSNPYYFFLTDDEGKAIFGTTYEQHQENIRKYLD